MATQNSEKKYCMDSRTSSILINLKLDLKADIVVDSYNKSKEQIEEAQKSDKIKTYTNLRSTIKESYLTGSLLYGRNFIM
ncbi:hypothetical protein IJ670_02215 [bacterium]|nr:hypothetical protein [bacterium]